MNRSSPCKGTYEETPTPQDTMPRNTLLIAAVIIILILIFGFGFGIG